MTSWQELQYRGLSGLMEGAVIHEVSDLIERAGIQGAGRTSRRAGIPEGQVISWKELENRVISDLKEGMEYCRGAKVTFLEGAPIKGTKLPHGRSWKTGGLVTS